MKSAGSDVRLVSTADKLHNARSILTDYRTAGDSVWNRFRGRRDGTLWYYRALANELRRQKKNRLTDQFELAVAELESLAGSSGPARARAGRRNHTGS